MAASRSTLARAIRFQSAFRQTHPTQASRALIYRQFHASRRLDVVKPFLLADIGEGITECQLIQWFVQPGARVEQFDKICEVQSDKASVEITSPFDGVIKKLYYDPDDMAITGKPLVDIDIQSEISESDKQKLGGASGEGEGDAQEYAGKPSEDKGMASQSESTKEEESGVEQQASQELTTPPSPEDAKPSGQAAPSGHGAPGGQAASSGGAPWGQRKDSDPSLHTPAKGDKGSLATPAVRRVVKEHNLNVSDVQGTGKDGRVLKEDVYRHIEQGQQQTTPAPATAAPTPTQSREDRKVSLTPVQSAMYKSMTKSLNIPHFLYSTAADMGAISTIRSKLNSKAQNADQKITHLSFILKAVSLAFQHHPLLNSSLNTSDPKKPELTHKGSHNFGVAVDAPAGLVVPVVKNVQDLSVSEIAATLRSLGQKARDNKLAPGDFSGATFTVSNIGSVGGGVVAPVISEPQVAIIGIGRSRMVPAFDEDGELVKKEELILNWSADHRVVDGAECARCAERVKGYLEDPGSMVVGLR